VAYAAGNAPTYPVIVEIDKSIEQIRPGMAANVSFLFTKAGSKAEATMVVPVEAVGKDQEGNYVYILKEGANGVYVAEKKTITIGALRSDGFELKAGLTGGEIVATAGLKSLMNGVEVKLLAD
ncbi:MAG: hypothetical protein AAFU60_18585, partial [Bacteroidota bacterium]